MSGTHTTLLSSTSTETSSPTSVPLIQDTRDALLPAPVSWFDDEPQHLSNARVSVLEGEEKSPKNNDKSRQSVVEVSIHCITSRNSTMMEKRTKVAETLHDCDENFAETSVPYASADQDHGTKSESSQSAQDSVIDMCSSDMCSSDEDWGLLSTSPQSLTDASSASSIAAPAPTWAELSGEVFPAAAREVCLAAWGRLVHAGHCTAATGRWRRRYTDLHTPAAGYDRSALLEWLRQSSGAVVMTEQEGSNSRGSKDEVPELPPVSTLSWIQRQLVAEWRTYHLSPSTSTEAMAESGTTKLHEDWHTLGDDGEQSAAKRTAASSGEDDEFSQARTFVPAGTPRPTWAKADACFSCRQTFGPSRLRHHCRNCGRSFCQSHTAHRITLPHLGYRVPERCCESCRSVIAAAAQLERIAWRRARCRDYFAETGGQSLTPYFETGVDTVELVMERLTRAAICMAKAIPLGAQATVAVETIDVLRKYGLNGIYTIMLRQEFLAAADLLRKALGINETAWPLSVHELSAAIFYALAQHRAMRGLNPEQEHNSHACHLKSAERKGRNGLDDLMSESTLDAGHKRPIPVCDRLPDADLNSLILYAPIALNFVYADKEVDMQLLAAQQSWRLVYAQLEQKDLKDAPPAVALFCNSKHRICCFAVRGTTTIQDVITDIRQVPLPFPEAPSKSRKGLTGTSEEEWTEIQKGQGVAVCGMASAAMHLYTEHKDALLAFARRGFRVRLTGHSLGGGVATLLGILLRRDIAMEACSMEGVSNESQLHVYSFGTPPCLDGTLAKYCESFVTTIILHDDAVPRLTPESCRDLMKHLLQIRETWVKEHLPDDIMAITNRAKTVWAPRWRGSFTLPTSSSSIKRYCRKHYQYGKSTILSVCEKLIEGNKGAGEMSSSSIEVVEEIEGDRDPATGKQSDLHGAVPPGTNEEEEEVEENLQEQTEGDIKIATAAPVVEFMGGIDSKVRIGVVVEGEEFFDAGDELLEATARPTEDDEHDSFHEALEAEGSRPSEPASAPSTPSSSTEGSETVILEENPLPNMYVPGKVVHIYAHRGTYKAAYVPRSFREIRRMSLAGNMLADHTCKSYYEALLEVRSVRNATEAPPPWTAFDEDDTCSCCASRFTWASTSDNAAQEARDKHNCRSCGSLVCDPCSQNRTPLPSVGLTVAVRICDRCYHGIDGVQNDLSTPEADVELDSETNLPIRRRPRRSTVVDELAAKVQTRPLKTS